MRNDRPSLVAGFLAALAIAAVPLRVSAQRAPLSLADALVIRGWLVLHLGAGAGPVEHELTPFAIAGSDHRLTYPPAQQELL